MKIKLSSLCLLIVCLFGCAKFAEESPQKQMQDENPDKAISSDSNENSVDSYSLEDIVFVTTMAESKTSGVSTEEGYYYIDKRTDGVGGNIHYIDHASALDMYLSPQPNSDHGEDDESYLPSVIGGGTLFVSNEQLFFLRKGSPEYLDLYGKDALPEIIQMNLDGSRKRTVYEGDAKQQILDGVAASKEAVYFISATTEENFTKVFYQLLRINIKTGKDKILYQTENPLFIIGAYADKLICKEIICDLDKEGIERYESQRHQVFSICPQSDNRTVLYEWNQLKNSTELVFDDTLLIISGFDQTLTKKKLNGTQETTVDLSEILRDDNPSVYSFGCFGHWWLLYTANLDGMTGEAVYVVDINTNEIHRVTLTYYDESKEYSMPIDVYGIMGDDFLVSTGKRIESKSVSSPDGTTISIPRTSVEYALISTTDYLNNRPAYTSIQTQD